MCLRAWGIRDEVGTLVGVEIGQMTLLILNQKFCNLISNFLTFFRFNILDFKSFEVSPPPKESSDLP